MTPELEVIRQVATQIDSLKLLSNGVGTSTGISSTMLVIMLVYVGWRVYEKRKDKDGPEKKDKTRLSIVKIEANQKIVMTALEKLGKDTESCKEETTAIKLEIAEFKGARQNIEGMVGRVFGAIKDQTDSIKTMFETERLLRESQKNQNK